jgi:hypothetical protein
MEELDKVKLAIEYIENHIPANIGDCMVEALEKQIPKKIVYQEYNFEGKTIRINGIDGVPYDLCPNCGSNLCTSGFLARKKMKYCEDCGQRLDWE